MGFLVRQKETWPVHACCSSRTTNRSLDPLPAGKRRRALAADKNGEPRCLFRTSWFPEKLRSYTAAPSKASQTRTTSAPPVLPDIYVVENDFVEAGNIRRRATNIVPQNCFVAVTTHLLSSDERRDRIKKWLYTVIRQRLLRLMSYALSLCFPSVTFSLDVFAIRSVNWYASTPVENNEKGGGRLWEVQRLLR